MHPRFQEQMGLSTTNSPLARAEGSMNICTYWLGLVDELRQLDFSQQDSWHFSLSTLKATQKRYLGAFGLFQIDTKFHPSLIL